MKTSNINRSILVIGLLTFVIINAYGQSTTKYFRHLRYNHVSPHVPTEGIYEISSKEAMNTSYYAFKYDSNNRLIELINNHYHTEKRHPLTTLDAYRTLIKYEGVKEVRTYFDPNGKRVSNERNVYLEEYEYDKNGFRKSLSFYDLENNEMESNWKIARYEWTKNKRRVIERRFNLNGDPVNVAPYFAFGITAIEYDKDGMVKGHYNLDESLSVVNNADGVASYRDTYDSKGNHIKWSYYDQENQLVDNQWGYAVGVKGYDTDGNNLTRSDYNSKEALINTRSLINNTNIKEALISTKEDSVQIKATALGYLEALQQLNPELMQKVMNESLAKRTIGYDWKNKSEVIKETTYEKMIEFAESWNKSGNKFPMKPNNQVFILDIYNQVAAVKLRSDNWVEYLHLIKTNGEWSIINMLWSQKDISFYEH